MALIPSWKVSSRTACNGSTCSLRSAFDVYKRYAVNQLTHKNPQKSQNRWTLCSRSSRLSSRGRSVMKQR